MPTPITIRDQGSWKLLSVKSDFFSSEVCVEFWPTKVVFKKPTLDSRKTVKPCFTNSGWYNLTLRSSALVNGKFFDYERSEDEFTLYLQS